MIKTLLQQYGIDELIHMTHKMNIPSICRNGLLSINELLLREDIDFKSIADARVQHRRSNRNIGGGQSISIHDYVPLYFVRDTPMQYILTTSAPTKGRAAMSPADLVFVCINPLSAFLHPGMLFTDGNAASYTSEFYQNIEDLSKLDWDMIKACNEYPICYDSRFKRKKASEVLIPHRIPTGYIDKIAVRSTVVKDEVITLLETMVSDASNDATDLQCLSNLKSKVIIE